MKLDIIAIFLDFEMGQGTLIKSSKNLSFISNSSSFSSIFFDSISSSFNKVLFFNEAAFLYLKSGVSCFNFNILLLFILFSSVKDSFIGG